MSASLRLLFVADPSSAAEVLVGIREGGGATARLVPTADALRDALADAAGRSAWDAVVVVPGGPIDDVEVAVYVPDGVPLVIVDDEVPLLLMETAAQAVPRSRLHELHQILPAAETSEAAEDDPGAPVDSPGPTPALATDPAAVADHLPIGLYRSDENGRILYANPALARVLGCPSVEALAGIDVRTDLGYPRETFVEEIRQSGVVRNLIVTWTTPTGRTVHTRENARAVTDGSGGLLYYEGTMEDVTAEVEARREEAASARQHACIARFADAAAEASSGGDLYSFVVDALLDITGGAWALVVVGSEGRNCCAAHAGTVPDLTAAALDATPAFQALPLPSSPVEAPDLLGDPPFVIDPSVLAVLSDAGIRSFSCVPVMRSGEPLGVLVWGQEPGAETPRHARRGVEALAWHLAGHLARTRVMRDLWDSQASLGVVASHTPHVLYRLRYTAEGGVFDHLSPAIETLTGFTLDEIEAQGGLPSLVLDTNVLEGDGLVDGPVEGAEQYLAEYRMRTRSGECWIENRAQPWLDASGTPIGLVGVFQDVTDRKHREDRRADAAQQALSRQRALVDLSLLAPDDALGAPAAAQIAAALGVGDVSIWLCDPTEAVCSPLYVPGGAPEIDLPCGVLDLFANRRALTVDDTRDGVEWPELRPVAEAFGIRSLLAAPIRQNGRAVGLALAHGTEEAHPWSPPDIEFAAAAADALALALERRERTAAQESLRISEHRHRTLSDLTSDYAFAVHVAPDGASRIDWATDAFERICGHAPADIDGHEGFLAILHPESRGLAACQMKAMAQEGTVEFEAQLLTPSGETRWVSHRARRGDVAADGSVVVYHSGQDVTIRKQYEADLVAAREQAEENREEAEEMNRLKSAFLANMSHEIRTPLTGILGYADLLAEEVEEGHREFVEMIERNGYRLLDTLDAVLDLSRLEAGELQLVPEALSVAEEVTTATRRYVQEADQKGIALNVEVLSGLRVLADPSGFRKAVSHLVRNAIKFTEVGHVAVRADAEGGRVVLRVSDTGVGISDAFLPHLFDEFRQEDVGLSRSHEGSGLGLTLTRRLVELMDGQIEVASRRPGGSVFTMSLPRADPSGEDGSRADAVLVSSGDGQTAHPDGEMTLGLPPLPADTPSAYSTPAASVASPPDADRPDGPFAFSFLSPPPAGPAPAPDRSPASPSATAAPTPMFDFRLGRSPASDPPASTPPAPQAEVSQEPSPASASSSAPAPERREAPAARLSDADDPVMIVRPVDPAPSHPTIPETPADTAPPEEAEVVSEPEDDGRPSILVVEDNNDTRMLLERILRSSYDVKAVPDARSALLAMNERRFSGLVLDINLGGKETGADVLRIARSLPNYGDVFAIALTAYALPGDRERLLASGFNEYISKPFTRQSLMETLAAGVLA